MTIGFRTRASYSLAALLTAGCLAGTGLSGCGSSTGRNDTDLPPILAAPGPSPTAVAPTLVPIGPDSTIVTTPNFQPITPPPVGPSVPQAPTLQDNLLILESSPAFASITLGRLFAPGVIANVNVQVLNVTRGTDITGIFSASAINQFRALLIGRGGTTLDRTEGIIISNPIGAEQQSLFTFPANALLYASTVSAGASNSGDELLIIITISDAFGQILRQEARTQATIESGGGTTPVTPTLTPAPTATPTMAATGPVLGTGPLQATLRWQSVDDLDLYLTDPVGETIFFARRLSASGGRLDVDANAACAGTSTTPVENIFFANTPPTGSYLAQVRLFSRCPGSTFPEPAPVPFELTILRDGTPQVFGGAASVTGDPGTEDPLVNFPFTIP